MKAAKSENLTPFQTRVYDAVRRIPAGKVVSYGALASAIGCRSARVVGQALRLCPCDDVPCHRVVASGLMLGGFGGQSSGPHVDRKKQMLMQEGIRFDANGRIDPDCVLRDSPGLRWILGSAKGKAPGEGRAARGEARRHSRSAPNCIHNAITSLAH